MRYFTLIMFLLLFLLATPKSGAAALSDDDLSIPLSNSSLIIRGVSLFRIDDVHQQSSETWIVAENHAGIQSGSTVTEPEYLDSPAGGKDVLERSIGGAALNQYYGTLRNVHVLSGPHIDQVFKYDYAVPSKVSLNFGPSRPKDQSPKDDYFQDRAITLNGSAICRLEVDETKTTTLFRLNAEHKYGKKIFQEFYLVPEDWVPFLDEALHDSSVNQEDVNSLPSQDKNKESQRTDRLEKMLSLQNPFLVITAWKALMTTGNVNDSLITRTLSSHKGMLQAELVYIFLEYLSPQQQAPHLKALSDLIAAAHAPDEIQGIALGIYAQMDYSQQVTDVSLSTLMGDIASKEKIFGTTSQSDLFIQSILDTSRKLGKIS